MGRAPVPERTAAAGSALRNIVQTDCAAAAAVHDNRSNANEETHVAATIAELEQRLRALEDINAIKELKARYLRACDRKQPDTMRDCFVEKGARIEAEGFPSFDDREGWVAVFTDLAVKNPNIMDMHHGQNPQITLTGPDSASALWDLNFCQVNVKERTIVNMAGEYRDEYVREGGRWLIRTQRFRQTSFQMRMVGEDGQAKVVALGAPPSSGFIENA
jgi:hypothetical protein